MERFYSFGVRAALDTYGLDKVAAPYGGGTAGMSDADKRALGIEVSTNPIPPKVEVPPAPPEPEQAAPTLFPNQPPVYTGQVAQTGAVPSNIGGGALNSIRRAREAASVNINKSFSNFQNAFANTQARRAAAALPITQP